MLRKWLCVMEIWVHPKAYIPARVYFMEVLVIMMDEDREMLIPLNLVFRIEQLSILTF